jgi:transposase
MILGLANAIRVFAYGAPVDMRKGYDGLTALVRDELGQDVLSGDLFLFVNKRRRRAKVLHFDGSGLCLYAKRLDKGHFACLWGDENKRSIELSAAELSLFLAGCELIGSIALTTPKLLPHELAPPAAA